MKERIFYYILLFTLVGLEVQILAFAVHQAGWHARVEPSLLALLLGAIWYGFERLRKQQTSAYIWMGTILALATMWGHL